MANKITDDKTGVGHVDSTALLGCPFCGGAPDRIGGKAKFADMPWFRVQCVECGAATGIMNTRHSADNNWNTRQRHR